MTDDASVRISPPSLPPPPQYSADGIPVEATLRLSRSHRSLRSLFRRSRDSPPELPTPVTSRPNSSEATTVVVSGDRYQSATSLPHAPNPSDQPAEIVLTWTENDTQGPSPIHLPTDEIAPSDMPPQYTEAQRPTHPVRYTFSPIGKDAMILVPPENEPDSRPKYHISVSMNCFVPSSYVTTIRRGGTEGGEFMGDFEMGAAEKVETLCIRDKEWVISDALLRLGPPKASRWSWSLGPKLFWDWTGIVRVCYESQLKQTIYAKFRQKQHFRSRDRPADLAVLEVTPQGQAHFDDILLTALIIERWRLSGCPLFRSSAFQGIKANTNTRR